MSLSTRIRKSLSMGPKAGSYGGAGRRSRARRRSPRRLVAAVAAGALAFGSLAVTAAPAAADTADAVATTHSPGYTETGTWGTSTHPGYNGADTRYSRTPGSTATWSLTAPATGSFMIDVYYTSSINNAKAKYSWNGSDPITVDQATGGDSWRTIGTIDLNAGDPFTITVTATKGTAISNPDKNVITRADAVRLHQGVPCGTIDDQAEPVPTSDAQFTGYSLHQEGTTVDIAGDGWGMNIDRNGFRYSLTSGGKVVAKAHPDAGLLMNAGGTDLCNAVSSTVTDATDDGVTFSVLFSDRRTATVTVVPSEHSVNLKVKADDGEAGRIRAQTAGGLNPAYGLGDLGGWEKNLNAYGTKDLDYYRMQSSPGKSSRFMSTFTVFPGRGLAQVLFDRGRVSVEVDDAATMLGVVDSDSMPGLHYFFGDMKTIYHSYATARHDAGYQDAKPDYDFFGVGYESYGALAWDTNQETIENSVSEYLKRGYPIAWAVTGSGFWPYGDDGAQGTTSSFGMWGDKYPDPDAYKKFFADRGIDLILGLRQSFKALPSDGGFYDPALDGPYTQEGLDNGYFITNDDGTPRTFGAGPFPDGKIYLVDPDNPDAVAWFVKNSRKWGVDGYKEDHMSNATANGYYDNALVNPVDMALSKDGAMVMVRNSAYSVPGSILRINDTDYNQGPTDRDRTVVNSLAYAASGAANFYPDIVGGRPMSDLETNVSKQKYLTRNAMMAAMSPSMSFGNEPWRMGTEDLRKATLKAAQWHAEYQPYIYSAAIDSYNTGYPETATPLPIAFPNDENTYNLVSYSAKKYEWMMGPSLLVAPLYGSDTDTAMARNVYLPAGTWMDIETGKTFTGPTTLPDYPQPFGKIPAFVGGTGILVHATGEDQVSAQVFPVAQTGSEYHYTAADGETTSTITANNTVWHADRVVVHDQTTGAEIPFTVDSTTGAIEFPITAGHDYELADSGAPTATTLTVANPGGSSGKIVAHVSVSPAGGQDAHGRIEGTVDLLSDGEVIGSTTLKNGKGKIMVDGLAAGTYHLLARYTGTADYAPSESEPATVTVQNIPPSRPGH